MVKNALEPSWEARFEGTSYGFRPGRSAQDAIGKIYQLSRPNKRKKWVVDADIEGAFDNIDHEHLLKTIGPAPGRELVRRWLQAGYVDRGVFHPTDAGTPQGGVISPLLANVALHGLEAAMGVAHNGRGEICSQRAVVKYADDLVVFCESREDALAAIDDLKVWLAERGLKLSREKTRVVHLTEGFDFLGFNVRQYPAPTTSRTGYKLLIKPSKASVRRIRTELREEWQRLVGQPIGTVIRTLNPIIRGQANYFPDPGGQRNVCISRPLDVPPAASLGEANSLDKTLGLAPVPILGPAHAEKGPMGVWRQAHRRLSVEIQLVPH